MPDAATLLREREAQRREFVARRAAQIATMASDILRQKVVPNQVAAGKLTGRYFIPPEDERLVSTTLCWTVDLLDDRLRRRTGFLRGHFRIESAVRSAQIAYRNWTILGVKPSPNRKPDPNMTGLPAEASEFGVLKSILFGRRR